ncbi:phosphonate C-P lyase system protein PhnG (plasmid) [Sinorhizobium meliloti]|uniref:phosphonate C-P lyase system protein PhnG n=1 Tax=Rhizobium meliloti TaxID=382 RepID=UPI000B4A3C93|nr:phosphonate C-P lyase system protein PhnG [Sinorhizobium meliloti]ASP89687.1 phosphonate C-P lyase system protein PhnG [Sinorhizobium meliloti]MQW25549.1 phosphonate C-P lyase system protein PhnG [Sinorhizobium meliloti]
MATLARATREELEQAYADLAANADFRWLRMPESGLSLVRGRAGGTGSLFNLGEVTMTRCALKMADGTTGFAFILGRDERRAELAAVFDAVLQRTDDKAAQALQLVAEMGRSQAERREFKSRRAASTKVNFFAMTRGMSPE